MTLLLRLIDPDAVSQWTKAEGNGGGLKALAASPPLWAFSDFQLSQRHGNGLSLFEVNGLDDARVIAGAFAFRRDKMEGVRTAFIAVKRKMLVQTGLTLTQTPGGLHHTFADKRHLELSVDNILELTSVVSIFMSGDFYMFDGKETGNAARTSARKNHFQYEYISSLPSDQYAERKNLAKFVGEKFAAVKGIPKPAGTHV